MVPHRHHEDSTRAAAIVAAALAPPPLGLVAFSLEWLDDLVNRRPGAVPWNG